MASNMASKIASNMALMMVQGTAHKICAIHVATNGQSRKYAVSHFLFACKKIGVI